MSLPRSASTQNMEATAPARGHAHVFKIEPHQDVRQENRIKHNTNVLKQYHKLSQMIESVLETDDVKCNEEKMVILIYQLYPKLIVLRPILK